MNLQFDSLAELIEFMDFASARRAPDFACTRDADAKHAELAARHQPGTFDAEMHTLIESGDVSGGYAIPPVPVDDGDVHVTEPAKRKRRTKAEIDAAKALEAAGGPADDGESVVGVTDGSTPATTPVVALSPVAGANPFATAVASGVNIAQIMQEGLQQAQTLAKAAQVEKSTDPVTWIPARGTEIGTVDALTHMNKCREFIGARGQQVYQRSFVLAGVSSNVMAFTKEQCAVHVAALEWLLANPDA